MKLRIFVLLLLIYQFNYSQNWQSIDLPFDGSVKDFAISESNPSVIYAACIQDGIYKTTNDGLEWQKVSSLNTSSIAVSKIDPNFVMTNNAKSTDGGLTWFTMNGFTFGEPEFAFNSNDIIYYRGSTLKRTTDFGNSWIDILWSCDKVLLLPSSPSLIYVVKSGWFYKSSDYGTNWSDTTRYSYYNIGSPTACIDINNPSNIWIARTDTIFISSDGGSSFVKYLTGLGSPSSLTIDRIIPNNLFMYSSIPQPYRVYKSTNGGLNWEVLYYNGEDISQIKSGSNNEIYLSQDDYGGILRYDKQSGFLKSIGVEKITGSRLHIGDSNNLLVQSNLNLYRTTNKGVDWFLIRSGIPEKEKSVVRFGLNNLQIFAIDYSILLRSNDGGSSWDEISTAITGLDGIQVNNNNQNIIFLWKDDSIIRTTDSGLSWSTLNIPQPVGNNGTVSNISSIDNNTMYYVSNSSGFQVKLFRSTDLGANWNEVVIIWENQESPISIEFDYPPSNTYLTAKSLFKSVDNGLTWIRIYDYLSPPYSGYLGNLSIDLNDGNRMFAYYGTSSPLGSSDGGYSWFSANSGLPPISVRDMVIGPDGDLFVLDINAIYYGNPILTYIENNFDKVPTNYELEQNFPNPYNSQTTISYSVPTSSLVQIQIFDVLGREVLTLLNQEKAAGNYNINFNASNLTSGFYFYRLQAGSFIETKKMLLLK